MGLTVNQWLVEFDSLMRSHFFSKRRETKCLTSSRSRTVYSISNNQLSTLIMIEKDDCSFKHILESFTKEVWVSG